LVRLTEAPVGRLTEVPRPNRFSERRDTNRPFATTGKTRKFDLRPLPSRGQLMEPPNDLAPLHIASIGALNHLVDLGTVLAPIGCSGNPATNGGAVCKYGGGEAQRENYFHTLSKALRIRLWPRSFGCRWSNI